MTASNLPVVQGDLIGNARARLSSDHISDFEPVFTGLWFSERPGPRFGDGVWEIAGADPTQTRASWLIGFDDLSPEWSLTIREVLYWRANLRNIRHLVTVTGSASRYRDFRAGTISNWRVHLGRLAAVADQIGIGLPGAWTEESTEMLRDFIISECPNTSLGNVVKTLYMMRKVLTLGGLDHDPTREYATAKQWAGDTSLSRDLTSEAIPPHVFHALVGDALTYVEKCASDILAARSWRDHYLALPPRNLGGNQLARSHRTRVEHPDVISPRLLEIHNAIATIGGIPTATVTRLGRDAFTLFEHRDVCLATLLATAGLRLSKTGRLDHEFIQRRIAAGTPKVHGGLPVPVTPIRRADGTYGPWRDSFCWQAIAVEEETLVHACHIVISAFTAMRDGELARIPTHNWRTEWIGADAITAPLVKNAYGEPMKWWATPPVLRACEILEQLAAPDAQFLLMGTGRASRVPAGERKRIDARSFEAIQSFVGRMSTDQHIYGFHNIDARWRRAGSRNMRREESKPSVSVRQFRFTLASISNFVALGDAAFQQQAKHAKIAMSHSYQANSGTDAWTETILNTLVNEEAQHRTARAVDLYIGVWTGESQLAGHAGRTFTRSVRDLLESLPVVPFNPDSGEAEIEQFMTQVMSIPELAAAIKSTAQMFHPGTVAHCLKYLQQMECTDKHEPVQGLCHPETCGNVLLDPLQQSVYQHRLEQTMEWLGMKLASQQRAVLENNANNLRAQLRQEGE